eukprot:TRINITY_DN2170_c0_g1_i2.p1 TRINITY_DN2170_c0_g1~~TRINITY_DN2170_c0_g1_i2.p1  ORF type:complete len:280 (-),score=45.30 TRINITY_DN2170_c0_g1_i2:61-900(-)
MAASRWAVDVSKWSPSQGEWEFALSLLDKTEVERISKFKRPGQKAGEPLVGRFNPNAKSSLVGRLLLREIAHKGTGLPYSEIVLGRTAESKPYLQSKVAAFPNFNFNVSHSGNWVVAASEPFSLIGVDVMEVEYPKGETVFGFFELMRDNFTPLEWTNIYKGVGTPELTMLTQFYKHWCLKESYIKAIGIGLGFELQRAQFTINEEAGTATISIDGRPQPQWKFEIFTHIPNHIIACAFGPLNEAIPSYRSTFSGKAEEITVTPKLPFEILKVEQLLNR